VPSGHSNHSFSQDSKEPQEGVLIESAWKDSAAVGRGYFLRGEVTLARRLKPAALTELGELSV